MTGPAFSSLIGTLTKAAIGRQQGEQKNQENEKQDFTSALALLRQRQADEQQRAVQQATIAHLAAQTNKLNQPDQETFGTPFSGRDEAGEGMFERGNRGTNRRIPGLLGPAKPEKEATISHDYTVNGQHVPVRIVGGSIMDLTGAPIDPKTVKPFGNRGTLKPPVADAKQGTGSTMSGQTMQTMGRMGTSFNDLKQSIDQMEKMENDPAFRQKLTSMSKAGMAGAEAHPNADAHGLGGFLSNVGGQYLAGKAQENLDPDLNTYLNLKQRVGTAFTELLPRPNQQLLQIEKGLSGIDVGWNPQLLSGVQGRRRGGLDVLQNILSAQGMVDEQGNITGKKSNATQTRSTDKRPAWAANIPEQEWNAYLASKRKP